jgi:hypothetical protein
MAFNINFLGSIPFNPDNLHIPQNSKIKTPIMKDRPCGFFLSEMLQMYWSVRSFKINLSITPINFQDPVATFLGAGGGFGGAGAVGGLAAVNQQMSSAPVALGINAYTQIVNKYTKKIRKAREGVINNQTQADVGGSTALDFDEKFEPPDNIIESRTYKPNEGTICAAGPLHRALKQGCLVIIDFSDIVIRRNRYYPLIKITGAAQGYSFSSSIGFGNRGVIDIYMSSQRIPIYIDSDNIYTTFIGFGSIEPGKRCCDRFYWDGKDEVRAKEKDCTSCNDDPTKEGVYLKPAEAKK